MAALRHSHKVVGRRHHIVIRATPKSATTRALMKRFRKEYAALVKKWQAHVKAQKAKKRE